MTFKHLANSNHRMTANKSQMSRDDLGLPVLRKSISEPKLGTDKEHHLPQRTHRHASSATPRIVITNGSSSSRHHGQADESRLSQGPGNAQNNSGVSRITADRSIDMINPRNFPVVLTKNFLRRRSNALDFNGETTNLARSCQGELRVTNKKYGFRTGPGEVENLDHSHGVLRQRDVGSTRLGFQTSENGNATRHNTSLPEMSWRRPDGGSIFGEFPGVKSDIQGSRSSAISSCSWQTYPLSSRPFSTQRGSRFLRGDHGMVQSDGFTTQPADGYRINVTNPRIRTRFSTPGQREHAQPQDTNHGRFDTKNSHRLPRETNNVLTGKPTIELLHQKRAKTATATKTATADLSNGLHSKAADGKKDGVLLSEATEDEEDDKDLKVRDWLSSLDSTLCQRYARRQMASLREYEVSNRKT